MVFRGRLLMVCLLDREIAAPTRWRLPSCSRPSRTLRAAGVVARRRAILDRRCARRHVARAGRDGRMAAIEQKDGAPGTRAAQTYLDGALSHEPEFATRSPEVTARAHAAVAARHVRNASSLRTRSLLRDVRWRWTLNVLWTAA